MCDTLVELSDESFDGICGGTLARHFGDLTVINNSGASCHMSHLLTGMLHYHKTDTPEAKAAALIRSKRASTSTSSAGSSE